MSPEMTADAPPLKPLAPPRPVPAAHGTDVERPVKIDVEHLNFYYGPKRALEDISVKLRANLVSAFIGPSRTIGAMNPRLVSPPTKVVVFQ